MRQQPPGQAAGPRDLIRPDQPEPGGRIEGARQVARFDPGMPEERCPAQATARCEPDPRLAASGFQPRGGRRQSLAGDHRIAAREGEALTHLDRLGERDRTAVHIDTHHRAHERRLGRAAVRLGQRHQDASHRPAFVVPEGARRIAELLEGSDPVELQQPVSARSGHRVDRPDRGGRRECALHGRRGGQAKRERAGLEGLAVDCADGRAAGRPFDPDAQQARRSAGTEPPGQRSRVELARIGDHEHEVVRGETVERRGELVAQLGLAPSRMLEHVMLGPHTRCLERDHSHDGRPDVLAVRRQEPLDLGQQAERRACQAPAAAQQPLPRRPVRRADERDREVDPPAEGGLRCRARPLDGRSRVESFIDGHGSTHGGAL